jgi:hypothetical protein
MKKALILLIVVGLMTMFFVPMALAADPTSGNQIVDGDVPGAFTLAVSADVSSASFNPAAQPWTDATTHLTCSSNIAYTIQVNCDDAANKTEARLSEWRSDGGYRPAVGADPGPAYTPKALKAILTVKSGAGVATGITVAPVTVGGLANVAAEVAQTHGLSYSQALDYTDVPLSGYTYHQVMTYTISAKI